MVGRICCSTLHTLSLSFCLPLSLSLSPLSLLSHTQTQWQEGGREDIIIAIMLIMERGRKKGGQLSTKWNLFDYKKFNLWLVLLSESSVHNPADHVSHCIPSLSLSLSIHTNRFTSSLTHSLKMILYEIRLFCIHYYNIMYIMKCVNVCVCTYISQYYIIALSLYLLV